MASADTSNQPQPQPPVASSGVSTGQQAWRERAFVSELPSDFLCLNETSASGQNGQLSAATQEEMDHQAALALQQHYNRRPVQHPLQTASGKLNLTIAQAKLTKNYGLTRMDPYVRLRLGHCVYETQTSYNGATNPHWNKAVMCYVPHGVTSLHLEIYDECSFTDDQLIASATIQIPEAVLKKGETLDDWFPLTGKQGENKEGMINLIMNYTPLATDVPVPPAGQAPVVVAPAPMVGLMPAMGMPMYTAPILQQQQQQQPQQPPVITPETVAQLKDMFPSMDVDIIRSVLESTRGDKSAAISALLELSSTA